MKQLTPGKIVEELNRHIIGQDKAKRAMAIAIRNRWRRQQVEAELRRDIIPKNIIMIGATGVGKTEIARRMAGLVKAPFLKVEATRYTEVGYVGRDVESMIRELTEASVNKVQSEHMREVMAPAGRIARDRILDALMATEIPEGDNPRARLLEKLEKGDLDDHKVAIQVEEKMPGQMGVFTNMGVEQMGVELQNMLERMVPQKMSKRELPVQEALRVLRQQEAEKLIDRDFVIREAIDRVENSGIVFIDEIDKVAVTGGTGQGGGPDVSREGVQRDLLPVVEGTTVITRYGPVGTHHILFIAAGSFHIAKPSDLIPEFQGRFPVRVELDSLKAEDFVRILTEPRSSLIKQYQALMDTEGVTVTFEQEAVQEIADIAARVNQQTQNIGARRLHTVMEKLMDEIAFEAPNIAGQTIHITRQYVLDRMKDVFEHEDLTQYIL